MPQQGTQTKGAVFQLAQGEGGGTTVKPVEGMPETHAEVEHEGGSHNPLAEHPASYYSYMALGIALVLVLGARFLMQGALTTRKPSRGQLLVEQAVASMRHFCESTIGHGGARFAPLVGTLFGFVLLSNLCGVLPFYWKREGAQTASFTPAPTANLSVTLALGLVVFIAFNYEGIRANGLIGHLKHFAGPIPALAPLIFPIELVGALVRPVSLAMRLFGNVFGEETVIAVLIALVAGFILPLHAPMLAFGVFGSVVQAGVFAILTCSYIALSIGEHGHHDHDENGHEIVNHAHDNEAGAIAQVV